MIAAAPSSYMPLQVYPSSSIRFELLTQFGSTGSLNEIGGRPALIFDRGWIKAKVAAEYQWLPARNQGDSTENRNRGLGGSLQFVIPAGIEFGPNIGYAVTDAFDQNGTPNSSRSGNTTCRASGPTPATLAAANGGTRSAEAGSPSRCGSCPINRLT